MRLPSTHIDPGTNVATPLERDGQLVAFLAELNGGLDGENVPADLLDAANITAIATDEWQTITCEAFSGSTGALTIDDAQTPATLEPILDDVAANWTTTFDVEEAGSLHVLLSGSVESVTDGATGDHSEVHIAVELDGRLIGHTDVLSPWHAVTPWLIDCHAFIPGGRHRLRYLWGWGRRIVTGTTESAEFFERAVWVRWGCR